MKTNKSFMKRIKITGGKKIMKRPNHQNHFNAKEGGNVTRGKKGDNLAPGHVTKLAKALISSY